MNVLIVAWCDHGPADLAASLEGTPRASPSGVPYLMQYLAGERRVTGRDRRSTTKAVPRQHHATNERVSLGFLDLLVSLVKLTTPPHVSNRRMTRREYRVVACGQPHPGLRMIAPLRPQR